MPASIESSMSGPTSPAHKLSFASSAFKETSGSSVGGVAGAKPPTATPAPKVTTAPVDVVTSSKGKGKFNMKLPPRQLETLTTLSVTPATSSAAGAQFTAARVMAFGAPGKFSGGLSPMGDINSESLLNQSFVRGFSSNVLSPAGTAADLMASHGTKL